MRPALFISDFTCFISCWCRSPTAPEEFRKVKHAFDVLLNPDTRQVYERLGDAGVKASSQTVISHKYIVIQMLVFYFSSVIFTFLMTFAESSGDAMTASFFGLLGESLSNAMVDILA